MCELPNPCFGNPCKNDAECFSKFDSKNSYGCTCKPGYSGYNCETDLSTICTSQTCFNRGTCSINAQTGKNFCTCSAFYTGLFFLIKKKTFDKIIFQYRFNFHYQQGSKCETVYNPCISNGNPVCQNNGKCYINFGASPFYQCECFNGYSGTNCELFTTTTKKLTTVSAVCADRNSVYCKFYAANQYCSNRYYVNGMPVPEYCPLSCSGCSLVGVTTPKPCADTQKRYQRKLFN